MKFFLLPIFMLIVIDVYAHQPVLNEKNPVSFNSPYLIEKPEVSKAIYSTLQGEPHIFKISSNKDFKFYAGVTVPKIEGCNQFDRMKNRSDHTPLLAGKESNISIILRKPLPRKPLHHYTILIGTVKGKTLGNLHKSLYS